MSEYINNAKLRAEALSRFFLEMTEQKETGAEIVKRYRDYIDAAHPYDVIVATDRLMQHGLDLPVVKTGVNRCINMLYKVLHERKIPEYADLPFFREMALENEQLDLRLQHIKPLLQAINNKDLPLQEKVECFEKLLSGIKDLESFNLHYVRKENILFPSIEHHLKEHGCIPLMWSYHDDIRKLIKDILTLPSDQFPDLEKLNQLTGDLFFNLYAIRFREEYILFPVVAGLFSDRETADMMVQAYEIGFAWIAEKLPNQDLFMKQHCMDKESGTQNRPDDNGEPFFVDLGTGSLTIEQAIMMLNSLPVDISYVDENDTVRYFSNPPERVFTRSKAIIGRQVEKCHPPSSVQAVKDLIEAFRSGKKDKESFWIQMGGKFLLIQYFALRDENKRFRGTLEVSQDITDIRKLEGEKRLMNGE
ncbi:MAG: DUF438 domain-containing protein [Bacteroidales bacterium]|nr:DUF438 domain-containing protein [Bacteroidales bacterium]